MRLQVDSDSVAPPTSESLLLGAVGVSTTHVGPDFYATIYLRVSVPTVVIGKHIVSITGFQLFEPSLESLYVFTLLGTDIGLGDAYTIDYQITPISAVTRVFMRF